MMSRLRGRCFGPQQSPTAKRMLARPVMSAAATSLLLAVGGCAMSLAIPSRARAAAYSVWACATGSGAPLGKGDWARNVSASFADVYDTCATPGATAGTLAATAVATSAWRTGGGGWVVRAAPATRITALDVWWAWRIFPSGSSGAIRVAALGNTFREPNAGLDPFDHNGLCCSDSAYVTRDPGSFGKETDADASIALAEANHQSFPNLQGPDGPGTPAVGLLAVCDNFCSSQEIVATYRTYSVKTVVSDVQPPEGTVTGLPSGLRVDVGSAIEATASDTGGGVRAITLRVDGHIVQSISGAAACADVDPSNADPYEYNLMKPCPSTLAAPLTLSAAYMPDNQTHTVTVVATDAAGQETVLASAAAALAAPSSFFDAANGFYNPDLSITAGRTANGSNGEVTAKVELGFVSGRRTAYRHVARFSTRPRIRGRLTTADKKPIAGARVWKAVQVAGGQWRISGKPLITSRTGRVTTRLPARTPSRNMRLVYFPYTDSNAYAASAERELRVQATTTIHSDQGGYRNGDTLTFTGRVTRTHLIKNKSVYLQALVRGRWRTFQTARADARGRWRMTHRFEATRRPTIYTFRAVVPNQTGYVWATGYSRSVRVLVTP